ncbi:MAG: hexitol phosphatase HxpB [bacterium]|jgi:HAD superfamily hydrolase (TIGR01509 family)
MKITTAIFDMDGLLIDSEPLWYEAALESMARFDIHINQEEYNQTTGLRTKEFLQYWFSVFGIDQISIGETESDITERVIQKIKDRGTAMEGVDHVIEIIKKSGLKVGLASSSPMAIINTVLEKINLKDVFTIATSAEHLPFGKPHPQVFLNCATELNSLPVECLCFEDSFNGLIAAKAARMKCILVPHPEQFHEMKWSVADLKLNTLSALNEGKLKQLIL